MGNIELTQEEAISLYKAHWLFWTKALTNTYMMFAKSSLQVPSGQLHAFVTSVYSMPYRYLHDVVEIPGVQSAGNIGSATGLFFEMLMIHVIVAHVRARIPGVEIAHSKSLESERRGLPRDPDLHLKYDGNEVVVELKVSLKIHQIEHVRAVRLQYEQAGIGYYLIGGYVSINKDELSRFTVDRWACFFDGPSTAWELIPQLSSVQEVIKLATIDEILDDIVASLNRNS